MSKNDPLSVLRNSHTLLSSSMPQSALQHQQQQQYLEHQQQQQFVPAPLIAVRVMDGVFVGNYVAAQDDEFLFSNKVSHIVNCSSTETHNIFAEHGIEYLTFPWRDSPSTVILDPNVRYICIIYIFRTEV